MVTGAARLTPQLVEALARLDNGSLPIAELVRRIGSLAEADGRTRPGYERIRQLVHELRRLRLRPLAAFCACSGVSITLGRLRVVVGCGLALELVCRRDGRGVPAPP